LRVPPDDTEDMRELLEKIDEFCHLQTDAYPLSVTTQAFLAFGAANFALNVNTIPIAGRILIWQRVVKILTDSMTSGWITVDDS